jgi:NAD(P)-dependent dehydrogenase (short-subunit alcohol dehydrogenase family)
VDCALEHFGRLDVLVSNAGWTDRTPLEQILPDLLARILAIQVAASLWLAQAALPVMKQQGYGRMVLTSSGIGLSLQGDRPELAGYAIGKAAQLGLLSALTANAAGEDIHVNIISPVAATRMYTGQAASRELRPEQVASGVVFLASRACEVSGMILRAANGRFSTMRWQIGPDVDSAAEAATPEDLARHWQSLVSMIG